MTEPIQIPAGTIIVCSCGKTVADRQSWREHEQTHDHTPSWKVVDAHTGREIS